ncbi:MAG: hypothetical protein ACOYN4_04780 [Bacteroidales bacterium]
MEEITLSNGKKVTKRKVKVRDLANAEAQAKGKEYLVKYALLGAKILIDGKPAVMEDILDMEEDDMINVMELFEGDVPND